MDGGLPDQEDQLEGRERREDREDPSPQREPAEIPDPGPLDPSSGDNA